MTQLTQILNAAFQELSDNTYAELYHKWMGVSWMKPTSDQPFQAWIPWDEISAGSPLKRKNPEIRVGFYPHAPFCDIEEGSKKPVGFEYDLLQAMLKAVNAQYPVLEGKLRAQWIAVTIPPERMGDGRDNMTIQEFVNPGLEAGDYDLVFTGVFYGGADGQYSFCHPTMRFWVAPMYTGLDNVPLDNLDLGGNTLQQLEENPLGNLTKLVEAFRAADVKKVTITNTPSSKQVGYGREIADAFLQVLDDRFYVTQKVQWVDGIKEDIDAESVHIYVGDLIQVQVMDKDGVGTHLEIQFGLDMSMAPYTYNPDYIAPAPSDENGAAANRPEM